MYGVEYLTHNIHNLLHLAQDVKTFGCLDQFSCFKYENYMSNIKGKVQNAPKPIEQLVNRVFEENSIPVTKQCRKAFPVIQNNRNSTEIKELIFDGFTLTKKKLQNFCLLSDFSVLSINEFFIVGKEVYISGHKYLKKNCFADVPCNLSIFNIFKFFDSGQIQSVNIKASKVISKCICIKQTNYKVIIPLLHCNN